MRVLVAMSGGVDSAVTAAMMVQAGHEVRGVHLSLHNNPLVKAGNRGCGSPTDAADAQQVAAALGFECDIWDFSERFGEVVVQDFLDEYAAGRTPNPCLRCNKNIKFAALLDRGLAEGYDAVATGHYARIRQGEHGPELWRAADMRKDQSYVLGVLDAHQVAHSIFPLGEMTKPEVRARAAELGFAVATKPDSTDICFIKDGDTAGFLETQLGARPGTIVDDQGQVLGTHEGTYRYTIGQRKGLNLGIPAVDGKPRYVTGIDPATAQVRVGSVEGLNVSTLQGIRPTWTGVPALGTWRGLVQVRAHGEAMPATITASQDAVSIALDEPCRGVAPGQSAVYYDGERVVGACVISATDAR